MFVIVEGKIYFIEQISSTKFCIFLKDKHMRCEIHFTFTTLTKLSRWKTNFHHEWKQCYNLSHILTHLNFWTDACREAPGYVDNFPVIDLIFIELIYNNNKLNENMKPKILVYFKLRRCFLNVSTQLKSNFIQKLWPNCWIFEGNSSPQNFWIETRKTSDYLLWTTLHNMPMH